jgi:hypothetical protein
VRSTRQPIDSPVQETPPAIFRVQKVVLSAIPRSGFPPYLSSRLRFYPHVASRFRSLSLTECWACLARSTIVNTSPSATGRSLFGKASTLGFPLRASVRGQKCQHVAFQRRRLRMTHVEKAMRRIGVDPVLDWYSSMLKFTCVQI